jgi:hypothetical protein
MRSYLSLQFRIINRHLSDFGIHPLAGYLSGTLMFGAFTAYLWYVSAYAPYLFALLGLGMTTWLSDTNRVTFIRQYFSKAVFLQIRTVENVIVVSPFAAGLFIAGEWLLGLVVIFSGMLLSLISVNTSYSLVLPTPFSRYPFEFAVGFRKNLLILLFAAFLLMMAILYSNANLGLFAVAVVMLVCLAFYASSEPTYLVWVHHMKPSVFLWYKIKMAVWNASILVFPFAIVFVLFFPAQGLYLLILYPLGLLYLLTALLGKYAFFPVTMNLPQGLLMAISFWFPPLLLFLVSTGEVFNNSTQYLNDTISESVKILWVQYRTSWPSSLF